MVPMSSPSPTQVPVELEGKWQHLDDSINVVSLGFLATAVLISLFLVIAIFERFLRHTSPLLHPQNFDPSATALGSVGGKLGHPSPKVTISEKDVSVLMPGDEIPTYIAHAAAPYRPFSCPHSSTSLSPSQKPTSI